MGSWFIAGALALCIWWAVQAYNRLVALRQRMVNAFAQIDVQLRRRHDLIPNLVEVARGYMAHEAATLEAVTRARSQAIVATDRASQVPGSPLAVAALGVAEGALGNSLGRLMVVAEAYPELQADAAMQALHEELASTENRIGFSRQAFNDEVQVFNTYAAQFPVVLLARLLGFGVAEPLQVIDAPQQREAPQVRF